MMFSTKAEYGVRVMVELARRAGDDPIPLTEIAEQIRGALDELGPGVAALAVSADPAADSPAHVRAFMERVSLSGRLEYLTGSRAQLKSIWRAYHVVPASRGEGAWANSAPVLLLDRGGRARVVFELEQLTPEALAHDVRRLESG